MRDITSVGETDRVRLLPPTTRTFTKVVDQNITALWVVFNRCDNDADCRLCGVWSEIKVQVSLCSVVMVRLYCFFFILSIGNYRGEFSCFEILLPKYFKKILPVIIQTSKQSMELFFLSSCSKHIVNPVFSYSHLSLF